MTVDEIQKSIEEDNAVSYRKFKSSNYDLRIAECLKLQSNY